MNLDGYKYSDLSKTYYANITSKQTQVFKSLVKFLNDNLNTPKYYKTISVYSIHKLSLVLHYGNLDELVVTVGPGELQKSENLIILGDKLSSQLTSILYDLLEETYQVFGFMSKGFSIDLEGMLAVRYDGFTVKYT